MATIETDKAEYEVEAPAQGVLSEPEVRSDENANVGALLAWVLAEGEQPPDERSPTTSGESAGPRTTPQGRGARPRETKISPKARRLAGEHDVDLQAIEGRGPGGLITAADVERAMQEHPVEQSGDSKQQRVVEGRTRLSPIQRASARRLTEAWTTVPHIVQIVDADVGEFTVRRNEWKRNGGDLARATITDLVILATARSLREHPRLNASIDGNELLLWRDVNAGVAVETSGGLLVPVIQEADRLSMVDIVRRRVHLAECARDGELRPEDSGTGTFTVSNLGAFGIRAGFPVLNAPEAVLVFIGAIEDRPVAQSGHVVVRSMVTLSIAYDHRVADGAIAARLSRRIRELVEACDS